MIWRDSVTVGAVPNSVSVTNESGDSDYVVVVVVSKATDSCESALVFTHS